MTFGRSDEPGRSVWLLFVFIAVSAATLALGAAVLGPLFIGWYSEADRPSWEVPLTVRGAVWYAQNALVATSAWLVWTYPQRGIRARAWRCSSPTSRSRR
jgi:tryptophan-rich sensory protein